MTPKVLTTSYILKPCPFGLIKRLDPVVVIFFKKCQKNYKCWIKCISKKFTTTGSANTCTFFCIFEKNYNDWIKSFSKSKWTGLISKLGLKKKIGKNLYFKIPKKVWCCFLTFLLTMLWPYCFNKKWVNFSRWKPCPFGLRKWLDLVDVTFFKNAEKNTSGGLILYLEKFALILYFNFLQKIFM